MILHDELSLKHEEIRKASESILSDLTADLNEHPNNYDIPSDEDPEAPEADSLASIISHRSHSSEEE